MSSKSFGGYKWFLRAQGGSFVIDVLTYHYVSSGT